MVSDQCSRSDARRPYAARQRIADLGGTVVDEREIADILYHALLVELPAQAMATLIAERDRGLAAVDEIMLLLPQTLAPIAIHELEPAAAPTARRLCRHVEDRAPIIALFDGMPLTGHRALTGPSGARRPRRSRQPATRRISASTAPRWPRSSCTATGMRRARCRIRLYVRPVLVPDGAGAERFPGNVLAVYVGV